ncbi:MFS transporter [Aureimonas endophytica]|uniref:MFS transporter n=1 Tax=Aureimonas endophytica TaxID=2027858 RepID=A0A916ZMZ7_9HYPH|nr:MDR family MFS transporter [Aureimonas endophytica]GGE03639.1 MFS transporter [Aureimonas endophytica]
MLDSSQVRRPLVLGTVMASMAMIAIEATIVSTAMPQIASQLGDLHLYSWVFSSFLLTQTALTVVFGKLADLYGRKPVLMFGCGIFVVASILCGLAWSMPSLIVFRLLQGIGAGAIQPVGMTVVGDLYSVEERGKIQGYLASVWGISSVVGPFAGGLIVQHLSWAWVFWINVPIGLLAMAGFQLFLRETIAPAQRSVDYGGAMLFTLAIAALMIALTEAGTAGGAGVALAGALVFLLAAGAFVVQERRARDPMVSFALWSQPAIAAVNAATLFSGMSVIGLTTFLPMYVQGVLGQTALIAGFTLTVMVLGWPIGATIAAKVFPRFGLRRTLIFGASLLPVGAIPFVLLHPGISPAVAALGSVVMGLGMGFLSVSALVIVQSAVEWRERGAVTASNIFARNLGSTLGAAAFGAVVNFGLSRASAGGAPVDFDRVRQLLDRADTAVVDQMTRDVLASSLHLTFWAMFAIAVLTLVLAFFVPAIRQGASSKPAEAMAEAL